MFKGYRSKGAPIGFAPDPASGHQTGDSRYLAIPFFDACLKLRLPDKSGDPLKKIDTGKGWLVPVLSEDEPVPAKSFKANLMEAGWLPNKKVAKAWQHFVKTGTVPDDSPPPTPTSVQVNRETGTITWKSKIDLESGLQAFIIERDGEQIGQVPKEPQNRWGRKLFQSMSYGDTPERLLKFQFVDTQSSFRQNHEYKVIAVNSAGLRSE